MRVISAANIYLECLDILTADNICYAVLHGWQNILLGQVSDIDIVIHPSDFLKLEQVLREHYRILNVLQYEASSYGFVLHRRGCDLSCIVSLDVSLDYRWKGRIFFPADILLEDRRVLCGFWICGPAQELMYLLIKKIYEKGSIPERQQIRIQELASELGTSACTMTTRLFGIKRGTWLYHRIISNDWRSIAKNIPDLRRSLKWCVLRRDFGNPVRYWSRDLERRWRRWRYPAGMAIQITGGDNADTTAVIEHLNGRFAKVFRRSAMVQLPANANLYQQFILRSRIRLLTARSALVAICAEGTLGPLMPKPALTINSDLGLNEAAEHMAAFLTDRIFRASSPAVARPCR